MTSDEYLQQLVIASRKLIEAIDASVDATNTNKRLGKSVFDLETLLDQISSFYAKKWIVVDAD